MEPLPTNEETHKFDERDIVKYCLRLIDILNANKSSLDLDFLADILLRVALLYIDFYHICIDQICNECIRVDICDVLHFILARLIETNEIKHKIVENIYAIIINFSDHSRSFALYVLECPILQLIIDNLLAIEARKSVDKVSLDVLNKSIIIVNNITRDIYNKLNYRLSEIKKSMERLVLSRYSDEIELISLLVLSYLMEESEIGVLDKGLGVVGRIIKYTCTIFENNARHLGFTVKELMHGLHCLSLNDNMKIRIAEEGGIPILVSILQSNRTDAFESTLGVIENLCFNNKLKEKLKTEFKIEDIIKPLENSSNDAVKEKYERIMWKIENKGQSFHKRKAMEGNKSRKHGFDVFLSYCWANKETVEEIVRRLKEFNIRVWIDKEQMRGSSIEAMANGIENSKVFIFGVSSSYKKSENCRHEAEYAFQIKKPMIPVVMELKYKASSWLGFLIGSKVYYEFSERRDINKEFEGLHNSLQYNLEKKKEVKTDKQSVPEKRRSKSVSYSKTKVFENWTENEVMKWLDKSELGHLKNRFKGLNGHLIRIMFDLRLSSGEYFNNSLKNEYGMKLLDVIKFHRALNVLDSVN